MKFLHIIKCLEMGGAPLQNLNRQARRKALGAGAARDEADASGVRDVVGRDPRASFIYRIEPELRRDARQFVETNLSFALRICRWILGPAWSPVRVAFAHQPAKAGETYAGILNAPVEFGAPDDALILEAADLDRRSPGYDAELLEFVERSLVAAAKREPLPFRERLEKTIEDLIAVHNPRLAAAAAALGVSERTLQRRLAGEGLSFQTLLAEKRLQIVEQSRLAQARSSLSILAERTGYSDASAVSRFIRARSMRGPADVGGRERRLESDGLGSPDQAGAGHAQSRPGR